MDYKVSGVPWPFTPSPRSPRRTHLLLLVLRHLRSFLFHGLAIKSLPKRLLRSSFVLDEWMVAWWWSRSAWTILSRMVVSVVLRLRLSLSASLSHFPIQLTTIFFIYWWVEYLLIETIYLLYCKYSRINYCHCQSQPTEYYGKSRVKWLINKGLNKNCITILTTHIKAMPILCFCLNLYK